MIHTALGFHCLIHNWRITKEFGEEKMMYFDFEDLVEDDIQRCLNWDYERLINFVESEQTRLHNKWKSENSLAEVCIIPSLGRMRLFESDYLEFLLCLPLMKRKQIQEQSRYEGFDL